MEDILDQDASAADGDPADGNDLGFEPKTLAELFPREDDDADQGGEQSDEDQARAEDDEKGKDAGKGGADAPKNPDEAEAVIAGKTFKGPKELIDALVRAEADKAEAVRAMHTKAQEAATLRKQSEKPADAEPTPAPKLEDEIKAINAHFKPLVKAAMDNDDGEGLADLIAQMQDRRDAVKDARIASLEASQADLASLIEENLGDQFRDRDIARAADQAIERYDLEVENKAEIVKVAKELAAKKNRPVDMIDVTLAAAKLAWQQGKTEHEPTTDKGKESQSDPPARRTIPGGPGGTARPGNGAPVDRAKVIRRGEGYDLGFVPSR